MPSGPQGRDGVSQLPENLGEGTGPSPQHLTHTWRVVSGMALGDDCLVFEARQPANLCWVPAVCYCSRCCMGAVMSKVDLTSAPMLIITGYNNGPRGSYRGPFVVEQGWSGLVGMVPRPGSLYVPSSFCWGGMTPRKPLGEAELLLPFSQPRPRQDLQERAEAEGLSSGAGCLGHSTPYLWTASGAGPSSLKSL